MEEIQKIAEEVVKRMIQEKPEYFMKMAPENSKNIVSQDMQKSRSSGETDWSQRKLITENMVKSLGRGARKVFVGFNTIITPLARDIARREKITFEKLTSKSKNIENPGARTPEQLTLQEKRIAIASDHGGFALKGVLVPYLKEIGFQVLDLGPATSDQVDYPDYALRVAESVSKGEVFAGIMIDGAGIGSAMAANKVPGIRAALCYDISTAKNSREHNHANYLTLGGGLIGPGLAKQIVTTWLETPWGGDRHKRRVDKIMKIEEMYFKQI